MSVQNFNTLTGSQRKWLNHLQCCQARGQSMAAYAKVEGLDLKTLYNWRYRLKKKGVLEDAFLDKRLPPAHFQKLVVTRETSCSGAIRLHCPNGRILEFDSGVDPGYVKQLIEGLEG